MAPERTTVTANPKEAAISDSPDGDRNNSIDLIATMGWEPLPYGCVGIARSREVGSSQVVWSWIILIPWAVNDSKPWIDGTTLFDLTLKTDAVQEAEVFQEMRNILDSRYGESVAKQSVEDFLRDFEIGD